MATAKIFSAATVGFDGRLIEIECDMTNGLPAIIIVGLANKAIDEAKERIRSGLRNSNLVMPRKRITLNLAPADLPKDGTLYDLPMAIALLYASGQIPQIDLTDSLFIGELALDGTLRPVSGVIAYTEAAKRKGCKHIFMPAANAKQATLIEGISIYPINTLSELVAHLQTPCIPPCTNSDQIAHKRQSARDYIDFGEVYGQQHAKRALEVAVAGSHNILMNGPPGAGKTMLARALLSIMPAPTVQEVIAITKLHSLAGEIVDEVLYERPFRSPHHTASSIALVGGGKNSRPGEISLAHKGILFLDELPEYPRSCLETLRQPLEDKIITVARAQQTRVFPADFMLVATQNPCPCGYYLEPDRECVCTPHQINQYAKKVSGPLLDRIDIVVHVKKVPHEHLLSNTSGADKSKLVAARIIKARNKQLERFNSAEVLNTHMKGKDLLGLGKLQMDAKHFLEAAAEKLNLSARSYIKTARVARTIADLDGSETIEIPHVSEALQYRLRQP